MQLIAIDEKQADNLTRQKNIWWEGWDLMIWFPNPHGFTKPYGAFRNGRWGMQNRIPVNTEGKWEVPARYVRPNR